MKTKYIASNLSLSTLAALLCLLPPLTHAETAVQAYAQRYNGPGNRYALQITELVTVDAAQPRRPPQGG